MNTTYWKQDGAWRVSPTGIYIHNTAIIGERARIGANTTFINICGIDQQRGYVVAVCHHPEKGAIVTAGCREFTLADARQHWGKAYTGSGDRAWYVLALEYAERLHYLWLQTHAKNVAK